MNKIRPIAIYLPQFHPIPENDEWWGKGFTEWRNVVSAQPLFEGHYQPHLPADLGFYDLRLNEVFYDQIKMAKKYGIFGFMFYEYWFDGKRLLEKPIENYLNDPKIDFPYFLCWANENWTRRWDGQDKEVLFKQYYTRDDFSLHFDKVYARHIVSNKYIKINGKPVIAVYNPHLIPNLQEMLSDWRTKAKEIGFEDLYLINCESRESSEKSGFDASYEFQPNWKIVSGFNVDKKKKESLNILDYLPSYRLRKYIKKKLILSKAQPSNQILDYKQYVLKVITQNFTPEHKRFPCVMPGWDNSPRRKKGNAIVFADSSPKVFKEWFRHTIQSFKPYTDEENFIFINAWNEWAEGAHLEPCQKYGHEYLQVVKDVLGEK